MLWQFSLSFVYIMNSVEDLSKRYRWSNKYLRYQLTEQGFHGECLRIG